jgi:hypothetical protein
MRSPALQSQVVQSQSSQADPSPQAAFDDRARFLTVAAL